MKIIETSLPDFVVLESPVYRDDRGLFQELWHQGRHRAAGIPPVFVQDNISKSSKNVIRGLHYQHPASQGKLITVLAGKIFDVAVDLRLGSATFGRWAGVTLSADEGRQAYVPEGFAHGFCALSDETIVHYKCTRPYDPKGERSVLWSDPDLGIEWPVSEPILSVKDRLAPRLAEISPECFSCVGP